LRRFISPTYPSSAPTAYYPPSHNKTLLQSSHHAVILHIRHCLPPARKPLNPTTNTDLKPPGRLWKTGYTTGALKTPLFPDVLPTLQSWKSAGKDLAIFSSGSVQAQLQFFSYVQVDESSGETQDLRPLFKAHFDTVSAGSKVEKESYGRICRELGVAEGKVTFLTDNVKGEWLSPLFLVLFIF
jgi:hypothetical protein